MKMLKSWGWMRALRLIFGIIAIAQAVAMSDMMLGIAGLLVGGMALLHIGCCGANGCQIDNTESMPSSTPRKVEYEEI